ncbi:MAG: hypothetical protein EAZ92_15960 [Candidatus Kapaibacterium sp.]|nr:MAG: hypothetical protein EAZ92_15960 [Candidatus Kapabacteria bacterium]
MTRIEATTVRRTQYHFQKTSQIVCFFLFDTQRYAKSFIAAWFVVVHKSYTTFIKKFIKLLFCCVFALEAHSFLY